MHDQVNNPIHYTSHPSGVECLEITRHMGFNLGNVMKYIWRADLKGKNIEDLKKAAFYLQDEIALREKNEPVSGFVNSTDTFNLPCNGGAGTNYNWNDATINPTEECGK